MNRKDLLSVLQKVKNSLAIKDSMIQQTHFCFEGGYVKAFNLNLAIKGKIEDSGINTLIPGKRLLGLLEKMEHERVVFRSNKGSISLKSKKNQYKLNTLDSDDFPWININKKVNWQKIDGQHFIECLSKSLFCVSQEDRGTSFEGICLFKGKHIVASDGRRLIASELSKIVKDIHCVIPTESVKAIINCGIPSQISFVNNIFGVKYKGIELYSVVINAEFPDAWNRHFVEFEKKELRKIKFEEICKNGLDRLSLFVRDDNVINISFQGGFAKLVIEDSLGSAEEIWEVGGQGNVENLKINLSHLKGAFLIGNEFIIGENMVLVQSKDKKFKHVIALVE